MKSLDIEIEEKNNKFYAHSRDNQMNFSHNDKHSLGLRIAKEIFQEYENNIEYLKITNKNNIKNEDIKTIRKEITDSSFYNKEYEIKEE